MTELELRNQLDKAEKLLKDAKSWLEIGRAHV